MTKTYVLIDLENRRPAPEHVAAWMGDAGETWIFYGEQQINLLAKYLVLGEQVSIVPISRPGRNSLDFHLVLYLGFLVAKQKKGARFVVVAEDKDYDRAIEHAQGEGIDVVRVPELWAIGAQIDSAAAVSAIPAARKLAKPRAKTTSAIYAGILKDIHSPHRPHDLTALKSRIQSRIGHQAAPEKVAEVMARLETMDVIKVANNEMTYMANADKKTAS